MTPPKGPWELYKEPVSDPSVLLSPFWQKVGDFVGTIDLIVSLAGSFIHKALLALFGG